MAIFQSKLDKAIGQVDAFIQNLITGIEENQVRVGVVTETISKAEAERDYLVEQSSKAKKLILKLQD